MSFADELLIKHHALLEPDDTNAFIDGMRIEAPLLMFKALLLQSWCGLSDPTRKTTHPRLVFCRSIGLKRNAVRVGLMRIGYNMKRGLNLLRKCVEL
jgi:hypothetical protein